ncbi:hypothetical protein [Kineothrix sedimenti]|uniref:Oxaloacetate decarboxylase gamma subunit n=1 Tax=Kineothrix sedimenti TaxID=3123317 RepID=A0ABZ3EUV7_9FIRM
MMDNVIIALEIMGKGMGGIFIATLLIIGIAMLLSKLTAGTGKKSEEKK